MLVGKAKASGHAIDISAVIPTADRGEQLRHAVECVLRQSMAPVEIIVVDNGRQDADLGELATAVKLVRTAARIGPGLARNVGAEVASAAYVSFLDDDDRWDGDYLLRVAERIAETGADAVLGRLLRQRPGEEPLTYKLFPDTPLEQRRVFYSNPGFGGQNLTISRDVFLRFGGFDGSMPASEDRDLAARLILANCRLVPQPSAVVVLHDHGGGRARHSMIRGNWLFLKKHWRHMRPGEILKAVTQLGRRLGRTMLAS